MAKKDYTLSELLAMNEASNMLYNYYKNNAIAFDGKYDSEAQKRFIEYNNQANKYVQLNEKILKKIEEKVNEVDI